MALGIGDSNIQEIENVDSPEVGWGAQFQGRIPGEVTVNYVTVRS